MAATLTITQGAAASIEHAPEANTAALLQLAGGAQ